MKKFAQIGLTNGQDHDIIKLVGRHVCFGQLAQLVEHILDVDGVSGSTPLLPINRIMHIMMVCVAIAAMHNGQSGANPGQSCYRIDQSLRSKSENQPH